MKAYLLAIYNDIFDCIINPCVILAGAPNVHKKVYTMLNTTKESFRNIIVKLRSWSLIGNGNSAKVTIKRHQTPTTISTGL